MRYDFETARLRRGVEAMKWDAMGQQPDDVVPLSAADMELLSPPEIIEALRQKEMLDLVSELNVANLDEVYLVSVSGVQVVLGEAQDLTEKLEWMRAVLAELTRQGVMRGVLDVSTGKNAVYADR